MRDQQSRLPALQCSHEHPPARGAHTKELAVSTCEAAHSFRWPAMVVRCALATALVSTPEFALLSQRLTHASQTCRELFVGAAAAESANVSIDEMVRDWHVFRAAVMPASCLSSTSRCGVLFLFLYSNMTCYQTLFGARTLSHSVTSWMRLARAIRARS